MLNQTLWCLLVCSVKKRWWGKQRRTSGKRDVLSLKKIEGFVESSELKPVMSSSLQFVFPLNPHITHEALQIHHSRLSGRPGPKHNLKGERGAILLNARVHENACAGPRGQGDFRMSRCGSLPAGSPRHRTPWLICTMKALKIFQSKHTQKLGLELFILNTDKIQFTLYSHNVSLKMAVNHLKNEYNDDR